MIESLNLVKFLGEIKTARIKDSTSKRKWPTAKRGSDKQSGKTEKNPYKN